MTPLQFLAEVLPSPGSGYYCAAELSSKKEHFFTDKVEDLQPKIEEWNSGHNDVYFALATFKEHGQRKATNAQYIKSLFIDMDGYASKKDAALALGEFLDKTELDSFGLPWIVASGGGLHCYWPFTEQVDITAWKPIAENFKRLCKQEGLLIDWTVTADAARVLRIPGTWNHKKKYPAPREVKLLSEGGTFSFDDFSAAILGKLQNPITVQPTLDLPGKRPVKDATAVSLKLVANSTTVFRIMEEKGCGQIQYYRDNATQDGMEPVWRGLLSWAKVCEDGDEVAKELTALHPYGEDRMAAKLAEIKGPYPCAKMDSENPGVCTKCVHWGVVTNPLVNGRKIKTDNTEKEITLTPEQILQEEDEDDAPVVSPAVIVRPEPPRGFSYGESGGIYCEREEKDPQTKKKVIKQFEVLPYDLFVVYILKLGDDHIVHMIANRPDGAIAINLPQKAVVSKDETVKCLANQNVLASYGQGNDKNLFDYVRASVEAASLTKKVLAVPKQFGWQEDNSFVYNGRVFYKNGKEVSMPMPGLENLCRNTNSKGTIEGWRQAWTTIFIKRKLYDLLTCAIDSFGSALLQFTQFEGFVWHLGGNKSGTGKSLTLSAKAGVWGHPVRYRTGKGTSPVAMQNRAGLANSMPLLIDEITDAHRGNMEWAPQFIFNHTEGQGKERMESSANKERLNDTNWHSTVTMTSNEVLTDYMAGARKFTSNGELRRFLEWVPSVALQWDQEELEAIRALKTNYGVAGEAWVRWLVCNQATARRVVEETYIQLKEEMSFSGDERYWNAGCAETVAAAIMLGKQYANIIDVPVLQIIESLKKLVERARAAVRNSVRTADDVLNAYTRDNYGSFIIFRKQADGSTTSSWGDGASITGPVTRTKVLGRIEFEVHKDGYVDYFIESQLMKQHCVSMSYSYEDFKFELSKNYLVTTIKKDMLARTNGPLMRVNALHICRKKSDENADPIPVGKAQDK
jgi:hypothetical protein